MINSDLNKGFTLIEITIALAVLVIGLISVLALFPFGMFSNKRAADYSTAVLLAQQQLDLIKMTSTTYTATGGDGNGWYKPGGSPPPGFATIYPGFSWSAAVANTNLANLRIVVLSVYWLDPKGDLPSDPNAKPRYMVADFVTYIADYA